MSEPATATCRHEGCGRRFNLSRYGNRSPIVPGGVTSPEIIKQKQGALPPEITTEQVLSEPPTGRPPRHPKALPDAIYAGMCRVRWPDGRVSDMANLSRVNDAIAEYEECNRDQ